MQFLKKIFTPLTATLTFIGKHFKALLFLLIVYIIFFSGESVQNSNANLVEIELKGEIIDATEILEKIDEASKNDAIKGVLLNIDSPGGALSPSVEISEAIKSLNSQKPVVAYASGTMASGSLLSGIWSEKIYANKGSFIGSIGVIMQGFDISNLANKIGVGEQVVKAGEFKEAGTMMRKWSEKERESLQNLVNKSYEFFVGEVASARKLDANKSDEWANARVFLADDALRLGLIDGISSHKEAKIALEKLSGVALPIWQELPPYEKMLNKLTAKGEMMIRSLLSAKIMAK